MSRLRSWFLAPAGLWIAVFVAAPLAVVAAYSLLTRGTYGGLSEPWTLENYLRLADPLYLKILARSFWIAGVTTLLCLILGFPLALFLAHSGERKHLYLALVILPFWTSYLVRTYAWMFLLRDTGLVNTLLIEAGWLERPLALLYNDGAVILGLVHGHLPYMVLPLFATLERLDRSLVEAAGDLGAPPLETFLRVVVPLARPGIAAGSLLVFIPCLGAFLTPDLLGGGKTVMIGNLIQNQFTTARDWPFGAAASLALMVLVMLMLGLFLRRGGERLL
jgi:spermidine/putrescine transport system permease protein